MVPRLQNTSRQAEAIYRTIKICKLKLNLTLRDKCPYSDFFWSVSILCISPYSVQMLENTEQKNSE